MGIESDRLVYDYLSRVGDLAQERHLPASDRMKLVSGLRNEIDRRRATQGEESPGAVRGILGALGTPDEVVDRAGPSGGRPVPESRAGEDGARGGAGNPSSASGASVAIPAQDDRGPDGAGAPASAPASAPAGDWWRTDADDPTDDDGFFGFVGGIERPDLFAPPPAPEEDEEDGAPATAPGRARRLARLLRRRKAEAAAPAGEAEVARARLANPFVLLAALLLLGGAVFGSLVALAAGWLLAYASRRLTPGEVKGAVLVIPGLSAAAGILWLWGRVEGRWGEAVAPGGEAMGAAVSETWPWVLRGAATASALFLIWRSRRH
ncbi:hypothetical protein ACFU8I_40795 [Streptomyces sp. NPDC057540]|uniref:hypothetical protein n=1 Tax=Streptomyces sp. NPDC057540 TaxID=3346160 RepID=UPI0036B8E863